MIRALTLCFATAAGILSAQVDGLAAPVAPAPVIEDLSKPPARETDNAVRLQIFLDESMFGPGIIDGKPGLFTTKAVASWNEVRGYPADDWTAVNTEARRAVPEPFAVATVPEFVNDWVDPSLPTSRDGQAKRKRMSYRSVAEFMAERYHCDVPYLMVLNGTAKTNSLKPRDSVIVPNVTPFLIERLQSGVGHNSEEPMSSRHAVVDTKLNQIRIFEAVPAAVMVAEPGVEEFEPTLRPNPALIASFPITPGEPRFIKLGNWEMKNQIELPYWRYDPQLLKSGTRGKYALNIPPGPNSPVGVLWAGLNKPGIGLHGTSDPETIGRSRSAGCIRLANWDIVRIPLLLRPGATVEIR